MPPARDLLRRLAAASPALLAGGTLLCALLRLTVRDRWPVFSMVVYASPQPVMALALVAASVLWGTKRAWRASLACAAGVVVSVAWWLASAIVLAPPPEGDRPKAPLRAMGWNVARGRLGWDGVRDEIRRHDPDVAWLVEAEDPDWKGGPPWHAELAGYDRREMPGGLVMLAKGGIRDARMVLEGKSRVAVYAVRLKGEDLGVVHVDVDGSPWVHRRGVLELVKETVGGLPPGPVLIGGDFNTPRDSALLDDWRPGLRHAFEAAGRGVDGTWPEPIPFLSIDHCWVNDRIRLWSCDLASTRASDHRPVIVEFSTGE